MRAVFLTPEQEAALEEAAAAFQRFFQRLDEMLKESADNTVEDFKKLMEFIEIPEREKYTSCRKIGFPQAPQIPTKQWWQNRALFRPYKRGF